MSADFFCWKNFSIFSAKKKKKKNVTNDFIKRKSFLHEKYFLIIII